MNGDNKLKKNPEITAATKKAFIDAFCILSRRKSFEKITVQELSRKAGFNRCTFYQYFADIYELLEHIENIVTAHVKENFRKNISQENFMQTFFDAFTKIHKEDASYFDLLFSPSHSTKFIEKLMVEVVPIFKEKFNLPPENPTADYLTLIYFQTVISTIGHWINDGRKLPLDNLSKLLGNVLTNGVMAEISALKSFHAGTI